MNDDERGPFSPEHQGLKDAVEHVGEAVDDIKDNHLHDIKEALVRLTERFKWVVWLLGVLVAGLLLNSLARYLGGP